MAERIFVTRRIPEAGLRLLRDVGELVVRDEALPPTRDEMLDGVRDATALISLLTEPIDAKLLEHATKLRVIANFAVGYNNIDVAAATKLGIAVGNTPGVLTEATADLAFALLIAAARCFRTGMENVARGAWKTWEPMGFIGQDLTGKTLGIVGLGRIGTAMAKRCRGGWGMKVLYHNPRPSSSAGELDAELVSLDELLERSDFVSLHCPATATNRHLMGRPQFRKMKPTSVFVNTARGALVDQGALIEALRERWIFAAGIDVTDPEPPMPSDPLLMVENLVVLPHIASATTTARDQMAILAARNVIAGLNGEPLPHPVNPDVKQRRG